MLSFNELPNDILFEIAEILSRHRESLCKLRLVSRRLSILASPVLFRRLTIRIRDHRADAVTPLDDSQGCRIISAIASGSTTIYEHTKDLLLHTKTSTIPMDNNNNAELEYKRKVVDKIFDVISMFKNLCSFGYISNPQKHSANFHGEVIRALGTLPRLEVISSFRFYVDPPSSFTLGPISHLTKFAGSWVRRAPHFIREVASLLSRCPNLIELDLNGSFQRDVTLDDIFREDGKMEKALELRELQLDGLVVSTDAFKLYARHFKSLTSITIRKNRSSSASTDLGGICSILQQSGTCLEHVSSDHPEDLLLLSYLSSYSGLKTLELMSLSEERENYLEAVNLLYTKVLPSQSETLEELRLNIYKSDAWGMTPTENQLVGLSKCRKLRTLVAPSTFTFECDLNARTIWETWFKVGSQLPDLEHMSILLRDKYSSMVDNFEMQSWYAAREELMVQYLGEKGVKFTVA